MDRTRAVASAEVRRKLLVGRAQRIERQARIALVQSLGCRHPSSSNRFEQEVCLAWNRESIVTESAWSISYLVSIPALFDQTISVSTVLTGNQSGLEKDQG
jgi:hypothetical protein